MQMNNLFGGFLINDKLNVFLLLSNDFGSFDVCILLIFLYE